MYTPLFVHAWIRWQIPSNTLEAFLTQIEAGYCKHRNLYHNNIHAADVAQTVHYILFQVPTVETNQVSTAMMIDLLLLLLLLLLWNGRRRA